MITARYERAASQLCAQVGVNGDACGTRYIMVANTASHRASAPIAH
jgi:hypothetical protein